MVPSLPVTATVSMLLAPCAFLRSSMRKSISLTIWTQPSPCMTGIAWRTSAWVTCPISCPKQPVVFKAAPLVWTDRRVTPTTVHALEPVTNLHARLVVARQHVVRLVVVAFPATVIAVRDMAHVPELIPTRSAEVLVWVALTHVSESVKTAKLPVYVKWMLITNAGAKHLLRVSVHHMV